MHYYKFNIGDYARSTRHLSNEEDLAFRRLLDMYYETESPIPVETQWVARRIRVDADVIEVLLNDMFIRSENGWRHPRCDAEIDEYHRQAERNRQNGKRGGRPKTAVKQASENPVGSHSVSSGEPVVTLTTNHKPLTINHKPIIIREIPDWFPMDAWQGWVEMRKKRKRPLTERAQARAINKLEALHSAGHDIGELLDRSTINGWLDIYEPKGKTSAGNSEHATEPTNPMVRAVLASQAKRSADGERFADDWS
jgi:uncharacterized protein YdaU (DUF1376 family)